MVDVHPAVEQALRHRQRQRRTGGQFAGPVVDERVELVIGNDTVEQSESLGLVGRQDVGEVGELLGPVQAYEPGQQPRRAPVDRESPPGEDLRQSGTARRDGQVTAERHTQPGAGRNASDLGDGRLGQCREAPT